MSAEVVAADSEADLAVLRITGARNLPAPLDATTDPPVSETLPVYIFGFPGGRKGKPENPLITIVKGTVAGLRFDEKNQLNDVHINGDLNPGNSGGPVVDDTGRLIGVLVAGVRGKQIGFAIPTRQLNEMFQGSLSHAMVLQARQLGAQVNINGEIWFFDHSARIRDSKSLVLQVPANGPVDASEFIVMSRLIDPMLKLNGVSLLYAPAAGVANQPNPGPEGWVPITNAKRIPMKISDQLAENSIKLPPGSAGSPRYVFQISYQKADGQTYYTQPHTVQLGVVKK